MLGASHICKSYGSKNVLCNLDLQVRQGEIVGIIGENGTGKTTLFRILCSLIPADSGNITFSREQHSHPPAHSDIGYLPEARSLFSEVTVDRTLAFWARLRGLSRSSTSRVCNRWLQDLDLRDRSSHRVSSLSKGNLQKLQLACCMLHEPRLLILDEPFSGLDPANQIAVAEIIKRAALQGAAVLLSAHHLDLLERIATRTLLLKDHRLRPVGMGSPRQSPTRCLRVNEGQLEQLSVALNELGIGYETRSRSELDVSLSTDAEFYLLLSRLSSPSFGIEVHPSSIGGHLQSHFLNTIEKERREDGDV